MVKQRLPWERWHQGRISVEAAYVENQSNFLIAFSKAVPIHCVINTIMPERSHEFTANNGLLS